MKSSQRINKLIEILKDHPTIHITTLQKNTNTPISTLRRDLMILEQQHLIKREAGKIILLKQENIEYAWLYRENKNTLLKDKLCKTASNLIQNNNAIFIDSSTTCTKLATYLNNFSNLKIITNNLIVASQLQNHMNFLVFISGGLIKPYSQSVLDNEAIRFIHQFKTKYAFVSCSTIDLSGLYMADLLQAQVKREAIKQSEKTVALIDSSKFKNNQDFIKLCDLSDIDILITDKKITDTKFINFCKVHNIQIINS